MAIPGFTSIIITIILMAMAVVIATFSFDNDCVESPATLACPYKGPGVLTPGRDHETIRRLRLEQLTGLTVIMSAFADHVSVEYMQTDDNMDICSHLRDIEPRQLVIATDQTSHKTTICVSNKNLVI
jgi:hypothetical protein